MENVGRVGRKSELDQIQANSRQVGGETIPNSIEVENWARAGLSWEDRYARALVTRATCSVEPVLTSCCTYVVRIPCSKPNGLLLFRNPVINLL